MSPKFIPVLLLVLALALAPHASARQGCTVAGGNTLCCNCTGQGSCEDSGCQWSGGLDGQCGLKGGGKEFLAGHQIELSGAQLQFVQAAADLRRAEDALQKAKKRLADAQRAQSAAQKNMQKVLASQAMPEPAPQH